MKKGFQSFIEGIEELKTYLETSQIEEKLTKLLLQRQIILETQEKQILNEIAAKQTFRKRYLYSVAIVSLYGLLEQLVDVLIETYINQIACSVDSYQDMPQKIKENHVSFSMDLIRAINRDNYRKNTTEEDIIANLHSCLSKQRSFRMNGAAFIIHSGNITLDKIEKYMTSIGIDSYLRKALLTDELQTFFKTSQPERDISNVADQKLKELIRPIDELVDRRNHVSHGVVDSIESVDLLKERCSIVSAFGGALYNIMIQELLKYIIKQDSVIKLGKAINVYNNSIVCFDTSHCDIKIGTSLAAATEDSRQPFRFGHIKTLEVDGKRYQEIVSTHPVKFGAEVSFKANIKYDYYILPDGLV